MPTLVRRDPFAITHEFVSLLRVMDRMLNERFVRLPSGRSDGGTLPLDISEKDGAIIVRASLPGFEKEDIEVHVHDGVLSVKARHTDDQETVDEHFYRRERRSGHLSRRVALPGVADEAEVEAELKHGVLTLTVPQASQSKPKQIEIKGG